MADNLRYDYVTDHLLYHSESGHLIYSCVETCLYTITVTLTWSTYSNADLDLYTKVGTDVCWFGNHPIAGLSLNHDANPNCDSTPTPPEIITGQFNSTETFSVWYNQYSDCAGETVPTTTKIEVTNDGSLNICVNGNLIAPNNTHTINSFAYAGYNNASQPAYASGTSVVVTCESCP